MLLDGFEVVDTNLDDIDGNYLPRINLQIPPYLIIMIGKFYEGLSMDTKVKGSNVKLGDVLYLVGENNLSAGVQRVVVTTLR